MIIIINNNYKLLNLTKTKSRKIKLTKHNGYVLLEVIISLFLSSIIFFSLLNITFYIAKFNNKISSLKDQLDNISISHYFFLEYIYCADKLVIKTDKNSSMLYINTYIFDKNNQYKLKHVFNFKNHKINFGGPNKKTNKIYTNLLAENISDVKINYLDNQNLLQVRVISHDFPDSIFILYLKDKLVDFIES